MIVNNIRIRRCKQAPGHPTEAPLSLSSLCAIYWYVNVAINCHVSAHRPVACDKALTEGLTSGKLTMIGNCAAEQSLLGIHERSSPEREPSAGERRSLPGWQQIQRVLVAGSCIVSDINCLLKKSSGLPRGDRRLYGTTTCWHFWSSPRRITSIYPHRSDESPTEYRTREIST